MEYKIIEEQQSNITIIINKEKCENLLKAYEQHEKMKLRLRNNYNKNKDKYLEQKKNTIIRESETPTLFYNIYSILLYNYYLVI